MFNDKKILRDASGDPIPQVFNPATNAYEPFTGEMNVKLTGSNMEYFGNSSDTKPTSNIKVGATFFEIDTTTAYMFDGAKWVVI
ncbi:hypothetical protein A374_08729 [Fictibacillus macauensis ZFHKF-1]|uniref:Uncharacterized protein n=1 Tax=Fictibacillus macauensis ZFHKF-1 TaxID=1196324 RepID=I8AJE1_9BACL|nr:hypothetical protein [Fictibacillus macauensis]EIT85907.1 hypothetical protein A374_08729 [Fictibacillus macauensis ZFHKF-1]